MWLTRQLRPLVLVAALDGGAAGAAAALTTEAAAGAVLQLWALLQDQNPMAGDIICGAGTGLPPPLQARWASVAGLSGLGVVWRTLELLFHILALHHSTVVAVHTTTGKGWKHLMPSGGTNN